VCATSAQPQALRMVPSPITSVPRRRLRRKYSTAISLTRRSWSNRLWATSLLPHGPDIISGVLADDKWNRGCLIGDFSLETASQSELLRERLDAIFQEWRSPFALCIGEAQAAGEIDSAFDPLDLAEFLLASWEGAILRMKVERGPAALERFKKIAFQTIFKEQK